MYNGSRDKLKFVSNSRCPVDPNGYWSNVKHESMAKANSKHFEFNLLYTT